MVGAGARRVHVPRVQVRVYMHGPAACVLRRGLLMCKCLVQLAFARPAAQLHPCPPAAAPCTGPATRERRWL